MSYFVSKSVHFVFVLILLISWLFSIYLIFLPALLIYSLLLYLFRARSYRGEVDILALYSPVSGEVVDLERGISHPELGEDTTCLRIALPWWRDWGVYLPISSEIIAINNNDGPHHFRYKSNHILFSTGLSFRMQIEEGDCIDLQVVKCPLGGNISFNVLPGDRGKSKSMLGLFLFGGSVSLYLPKRYNVECNIGDQVVGAQTIIGRRS